RFGTVVTWFLLGGDLYTAYTFIAVPALVFGVGAVGFFALPYTILIYPLAFLALPRLWSVAHRRGYVTPADFVRGRYGSRPLATAIAGTGLLATMPYIALQLVGIRVVLQAMGVQGDWPLILAFVILAAYTYNSGLRAPALIAVVKDALIYITVLVAVIYIPSKLGGFGAIFDKADAALPKHTPKPGSLLPGTVDAQTTYASLALGSALALFLYPHAITGALSSRSADVIRRNMAALPAYSFVLGLLALLGLMAIAAGVKPLTSGGKPDSNTVVPLLFDKMFPDWFAGIAFAAIGIGALVPAAIMSIAAANLWTRNVYKEYIRKDATPRDEAKQAKLASLVVKFGAVLFIVVIDPQYAIDLQLIGGVIILQTLPAVAIALYTKWLHRWALVAGWVVGLGWGMIMLYGIPNPATKRQHFGGSALALDKLSIFGWHPFAGSLVQIYVGFVALVANLLVAVIVTLIIRGRASNGTDETTGEDYHVDEHDESLRPIAVH
ncbi:monocarboxylate uptake permease MctP, partial [Actinophytocola sp.]|uniref:monocarboxylate uptake permease MctP n=1 Tax=Actinophytocola sp. TaxID=1872138 RepID=UPI00389AF870